MYFCPNGCEAREFRREIAATVAETLDETGEIMAETVYKQDQRAFIRPAPVHCAECDARAEWRDARQEELFAVEPAMFG